MFHFEGLVALVQEAHHHLFAADGGNRAHAEIYFRPGLLHTEVAILGAAAFRGVHVGHDFNTRHHCLLDVVWYGHHRLQLAVHTVTHAHFGHVRLEMNIARVGVDGAHQNGPHKANDGRLLLFILDARQLVLYDVFRRVQIGHFHVDDRLPRYNPLVETAVQCRLNGAFQRHDRIDAVASD